MGKYYSQFLQDRYVDKFLLNGKRNGFFVDIGAYDGKVISNTYFFEKERGWNGLCFEPHPEVFQKLVQNRECKCFNVGIGPFSKTLTYVKVVGIEVLSGFKEFFDPRHIERINKEIREISGNLEEIPVRIERLDSFLEERMIDFLSIDTEGNELEILKSIDFKRNPCSVITIENNYKDSRIREFLEPLGYIRVFILGCDELYIQKEKKKPFLDIVVLLWKLKNRFNLHIKGLKKRINNLLN